MPLKDEETLTSLHNYIAYVNGWFEGLSCFIVK